MNITVEVPQAFSACGEVDIALIDRLMQRLNPQLAVKQVATATHVDGGGTVLWGLVCLKGQPLEQMDIEAALRKAGFDFAHSNQAEAANLCESLPGEGALEGNV
jgi:hypothetical protein